jgi:hypothetical protein
MRQWIVTCFVALGVGVATPAAAQQLQLTDLSKLSTGAVDVVDVSVDKALLGLAATFMSNASDDAEVKALLGALQGIYVRGYTFGKDGAYDGAVLDGLRRQLSGGRWARLVTTRTNDEGGKELSVYLWNAGDKPGGLAVLTSSPREVLVVNIVGDIDLEKLRRLKGQFGVPDIDLGPKKRD